MVVLSVLIDLLIGKGVRFAYVSGSLIDYVMFINLFLPIRPNGRKVLIAYRNLITPKPCPGRYTRLRR